MSIVWKPLIVKAVKILWPLEKKPIEGSVDEKAALNDPNTNQHAKSN